MNRLLVFGALFIVFLAIADAFPSNRAGFSRKYNRESSKSHLKRSGMLSPSFHQLTELDKILMRMEDSGENPVEEEGGEQEGEEEAEGEEEEGEEEEEEEEEEGEEEEEEEENEGEEEEEEEEEEGEEEEEEEEEEGEKEEEEEEGKEGEEEEEKDGNVKEKRENVVMKSKRRYIPTRSKLVSKRHSKLMQILNLMEALDSLDI